MLSRRRAIPFRGTLAIAMTSLALVACAGGEPPSAQLGASSQAIANAERAGALEHAPVELQQARDKMAAAREAVRDEDYERARRLAEQAQLDADLAASRAQSAEAREAAAAIQGDLQALRGGIGGAGTGMSGATVGPVEGGPQSIPPATRSRGPTGWGTSASGASAQGAPVHGAPAYGAPVYGEVR